MNSLWGLSFIGAFLLTINLSCKKEADLPDVMVYGHAGTTLYPERWVYPANTVESVLYALDVLDADGVEVDVQMTKDSVLVLYHDGFLDAITNAAGCIAEWNYADLAETEVFNTKYKIARLDEVIEICLYRNKKIFLDLKPYNYCDSTNLNYSTFNNSLNQLLVNYTGNERSKITVNTRNVDLLMTLSDTLIIKSFESENINLGITHFQNNVTKELCINYTAMTKVYAETLTDMGIEFSIFGVKTSDEIRAAVNFLPSKIISDNIAFTKKITQ